MNLLIASDVHRLCLKEGVDISIDTIRTYADKGKIPCKKTERGLRVFNLEDVEKFIEERKAKKIASKLQNAA